MVHVEVWLGDGTKTLGARWHRGKVQVNFFLFNAGHHSRDYGSLVLIRNATVAPFARSLLGRFSMNMKLSSALYQLRNTTAEHTMLQHTDFRETFPHGSSDLLRWYSLVTQKWPPLVGEAKARALGCVFKFEEGNQYFRILDVFLFPTPLLAGCQVLVERLNMSRIRTWMSAINSAKLVLHLLKPFSMSWSAVSINQNVQHVPLHEQSTTVLCRERSPVTMGLFARRENSKC